MAFTREVNVTKVGIGDFGIVLFVPQVIDAEHPQSGHLSVQIILSNGSIETKDIDLLARLQDDPVGQAHLANLIALRDYIKARLENELLPL